VGETLFDRFSRGRYATDASSYQMMPLGVVVPRTQEEAERAIAIARSEGVTVVARGGGTSQCGQTINHSLVVDCSKYLNRIVSLDVAGRRCVVQPGIVLDELNRQLKPHGLWFAVDPSTASRATLGGMTGNNSCGTRSLRYGTTRDNIIAIDAVLPNGAAARFAEISRDLSELPPDSALRPIARELFALGEREAAEIEERFPKVQRRVGGYNLDALVPKNTKSNLAHILVGSEGTLAFSTGIELKLSPLLGRRVVGVCHFGQFYEAMNAAQHLVTLGPIAVEAIDKTMLDLARAIPLFRDVIPKFVREDPEALLMVEFDEGDEENERRMKRLVEMMGDLGFSWDKIGAKWGGVVEVRDPVLQTAIADVRASGLNIMMSMKEERKPVSFIEDCAVPLVHLAEYTDQLTQVFEKYGTKGTWYAHASVGCLHVRPVLNLKLEKDLKAMRAIAEEAFELVKKFKGSHSGEHGDGIVRSEFHEMMFGARIVHAFGEVKALFDPGAFFNPGKIVGAPKFDDREYLRYGNEYGISDFKPALDWTDFPGGASGFQGAAEMCNNNGACRKTEGGAMCPSYRATKNERDVTRGRANSLRLALSGQLGPDALTSDEMMETLKLCVSCKACKRECPTGVDMAKFKIEVLAARAAKYGVSLRDKLIGYLPRYAPLASRFSWLLNLRDALPGAAAISEPIIGFSAKRTLPKWRSNYFNPAATVIEPTQDSTLPLRATDNSTLPLRESQTPEGGLGTGLVVGEVVLFADTFNRYHERENLDAALAVLTGAGYRVHLPKPANASERALCCGRTFLTAGLVNEARAELARSYAALLPLAKRGIPIVGLEPSCIFTFRDEAVSLANNDTLPLREGRSGAAQSAEADRGGDSLLTPENAQLLAKSCLLFEEFLAREIDAGRFNPKLGPIGDTALLHGHCHQKAFNAMGPVQKVLSKVPGLKVNLIESSCCGMAGAFGYQSETIDVSLKMAELSLLPAVRKADADAIIVADGTSCRHQIHDGTARHAIHVAAVLAQSMQAAKVTA
ncbi:MAG TPA: FAD-linked oxidase C-terminal domain-containing protein, partial [Micropepsaceae bacterium]|nr:FAD-linked oxidase C-terminal domain-containing protein [Micropepsaceae bacterium]